MIEKIIRKLNVVLAIVIIGVISEIIGHREAPASGVVDSSDEIDRKSNARRSIRKQEWQYEGLPIEFPGYRRHLDNEVLPSKIHPTATMGKKVSRRRLHRKARGMAIDMPLRRQIDNNNEIEYKANLTTRTSASSMITPTTTSSTQPPTTNSPPRASPPLDRRYRRIYNPDEVATIEEFPFMAALMVNGELWCGAVVISKDSVLTAAHCLQLQYNNRFFREYVKMLSIRVGSTNASSGGEVLRVSEIFFHPNYKPQTLEFNVALVKAHKNMTLGKEDPKVDLIEYAMDKIVPVDNQITFLGWGSVLGAGGVGGQVLLQKLELPVYDLADCQEVYGRDLVTRNNFCAGYITLNKNVCNHDAGGPAIMDGRLIGILSFSSKRCDQADQPAVFSTVGAIAPWIESLGEKKFQLRNTALKTGEVLVRGE